MGDSFHIRTLKRKNTKGLALAPPQPLAPSDAQIPKTLGINAGEGFALRIGVEFRLDLKAEDLVVLEGHRAGTSGRVSKVQHIGTKIIMARKVIGVEGLESARRRIVRELGVMHDCCDSEYLVEFYGAYQEGKGDVAFCMEYMDVGSLDKISRRFGPIRVDVLGKIAEAVLGGITYLYETHHIMHRDLKPSNILVNSRGQIKISDFEASRVLESSIAETFEGTHTYMAPERINGSPYTIKSDVWSVGIMLIELATAHYPYWYDYGLVGILDILQRICLDPPPRLPKHDAFPQIFEDLIAKCLTKDPEDRSTPGELYSGDPFLLASKRTLVDLVGWTARMMSYKDKSSACSPEAAEKKNKLNPEPLREADKLDGNSVKPCVTFDSFLNGLKSLMSIKSLELTDEDRMPTLCPRCVRILQPNAELWKSGKVKREREAEDGAYTLRCPLCRLIIDCLPSAPNPQIIGTRPLSGSLPGPQNAAHAVMKVGSLNEFMDKIMKIGASIEDQNTGSPCAFQMAAAWMTTCLTEHKRCIESTKLALPVLPTRVVDVGSPDGPENPCLHLGGKEKGLYFALSHRWGEGNATVFQTTKSNLEAYKESIPLSALPQTMQDAINITRMFGIRYLWIDALCIIQDSEDDWCAEAKDMASIYKNSLLTIAAAADNSGENNGCFRARSRLQTRPLHSNTKWPDGSTKYIYADRRVTRDGARPLSALDTRAWILQEQVLSPRVLSYSNNELYWDCISLNASETFPDGIPYFYDADMKLPDVRVLKEAIIGGAETAISRERFYSSWRKIVEEYSRRKMTKETDKLAALLGMAKEAALFLEDELLLGLWKSKLCRELLWWAVKPDSCARPQTFSAPTWSWSSINDPISFDLMGHDSEDNINQCIEIVQIETESNQTLSALSGQIIIRGKLVPMASQNSQTALTSSSGEVIAQPRWREDVKGTDPTSVRCLIVAASERNVYALGLVALDSAQQHYTRVGMVSWRAMSGAFGWDMTEGKWRDGDLETVRIS